MAIVMSKKQRAQILRDTDLRTISWETLGPLCQFFGQSGRGTKDELIARLTKEIWKKEYNDQ